MPKVPLDSICMSGGNLDGSIQDKIKKLIYEFGEILEKNCSKNNINPFVFPIFKPFNSFSAITKNELILFFSPVNGMPNRQWHDLTDTNPEPTAQSLSLTIQNQLGWTDLSFIYFPVAILDEDSSTRENELFKISQTWIENITKMAERQQKIVRINPIFHGRDFEIENDLCFILMPFREPFDTIYKEHIKPTIEKKFRTKRSDTIFKSSEIIEDIWEHINKAKFIIADVTEKNPNVFYELGIAHTVGKEVFIITQNKEDVPFDVKHRRFFEYSNDDDGLKKLREDLEKAIQELQ